MATDFDDKMKDFLESKSQDMAAQFQQMQSNLSTIEVTGIGGVDDHDKIYVKVTLNGLQEVKNIDVGEGSLKNGAKVTADLTKAAFNSALEDLKSVMQKEIMNAYKNAGIPTGNESTNDD
jgi:DNA-binding protein YbaB